MAAKKPESPYKLTLDQRVLQHLGINLYSNAAAVLSEAVANAWDADAELVTVDIDNESIKIQDSGIGMNLEQINDRFLNVGYDKRAKEGEKSPAGRSFMGRKGIGKLALFSIAEIVKVHTISRNEKHAFKMVTDDIKEAIERHKPYYPTPIAFKGPAKGTKIVLERLKKKRTTASVVSLRKRIARRFSVFGFKSKKDRFEVRINGEPIGAHDREDLRAVEFLWEFGSKEIPASSLPKMAKRFVLPSVVDGKHPEWTVKGWLGAADEPKKLKHDEAGVLNGIVVIARGRLIQENVLDKLGFNRILVSYLTGQVEADFLDLAGQEDIATSDRQRMVEDDERYTSLILFLKSTLISIQDKWTKLRNEARGKQAVEEIPALAEWIATLPLGQRQNAQRVIGIIRGVELDDEDERKQLYKAGMIAFERLRLQDQAHELSGSQLTAATLLPLLSDLATLEASMYRDIVRVRLEVIKEFEDLVDGNEKEKILQKHLFENLWLLDPGWERATGSERIEKILKKDYREFKPSLTDAQSKGRVDITYRTNAGEHIIVELKRAKRKLSVGELIDQGNKYKAALHKCILAEGTDPSPHISVIFVVGTRLNEEDDPGGTESVKKTLAGINARAVHYETLISSARAQYREFLDQSGKADKLDKILKKV